MYQSRNPQDGNGVQSHPSTDIDTFQPHSSIGGNGFQQRPPQEGSARYTGAQTSRNTNRASKTGFLADKPKFQGRTTSDEGRPAQPRRSRFGHPRSSRDSDYPERRPRTRGPEQGFDSDRRRGPKVENWTKEEQQYLKEKAERKSQFIVREYVPVELSREALTGMAPATASDESGMSEMLGERLLLARKYLDREFIQWDSKEQKADVMAVVEKLNAIRAGVKANGSVKEAETTSPTSANGDERAQTLMQKLIAGEYAKFKRPGGHDVLGNVERHLQRNDSFYPDDEKSLLETVRSIMPAVRLGEERGMR